MWSCQPPRYSTIFKIIVYSFRTIFGYRERNVLHMSECTICSSSVFFCFPFTFEIGNLVNSPYIQVSHLQSVDEQLKLNHGYELFLTDNFMFDSLRCCGFEFYLSLCSDCFVSGLTLSPFWPF